MGGPGSGQDPRDATAKLLRHQYNPKTAAITHGLYTRCFYPCDGCRWRSECEEFTKGGTCVLEERVFEDRVAEIMALPQVEMIDRPRVVRAVMDEIRAAVGEAWLRAAGEYRIENGELKYHAAARDVARLKDRADKALDALGVGPKARRELADTNAGPDLGVLVRAAAQAEAAKRAQATDAEFIDEEAGDDGDD